MLTASVTLIAALAAAVPEGGDVQLWGDVATEVVEAGAMPRQRWAASGLWKRRGDLVETRVLHQSADRVRIAIADGDGYSGHPVTLELLRGADGRWSGRASACYYSCTIHPAENYIDVHGVVRVQVLDPAASGPLRLAYQLQVIDEYLYDERNSQKPRLLSGAVDVRLDESLALPVLESQRWSEDGTVHEVRDVDENGVVRALGSVDGSGRRQGAWSRWSADGARESSGWYVDGLLQGYWFGYTSSGALHRVTHFQAGIADGLSAEIRAHGMQLGRVRDDSRVGRWFRLSKSGCTGVEHYLFGLLHGDAWYKFDETR